MPTNRRKRTRHARTLDEFKLHDLHHGPGACLLAGCGYYAREGKETGFYWQLGPTGQAAILDEMREDWTRNRETILATWTGSGLPWAARQFDGGAND